MEPPMTDRLKDCTECETELTWEGDIGLCDCGVVHIRLTNVATGDQQIVKARIGKGACYALSMDLHESVH
jgi:hypothetical protein